MVERDLARLGAQLLVETVDDLTRGRVHETPQDDTGNQAFAVPVNIVASAPPVTKLVPAIASAAIALRVVNFMTISSSVGSDVSRSEPQGAPPTSAEHPRLLGSSTDAMR